MIYKLHQKKICDIDRPAAGPRRYKSNPVFQIVTHGICNPVLKLHNPIRRHNLSSEPPISDDLNTIS